MMREAIRGVGEAPSSTGARLPAASLAPETTL
jgi:hypothetical protein